jgi:SAM-dependent methyltransferase
MHASSMENMARCYQRYVVGSALEQQRRVRVLDLGGSDVNGSYRDIFAHPRYAYTAADIAAGPGVHLVLQDPYRLPIEDGSVDIIISGQMLEHCEFFWLTFAEMVRVLAPGGFIFLIAPSAGPEHRYPVDCYRFYPDAYRALAR